MTISTAVIEIYRKKYLFLKVQPQKFTEVEKIKKTFMLQSTHKMATLNQNEICAALCLKRQYKIHDGEKWLSEILHIAGLLNSENPVQIQTQTFIKHVLPVKVRAINCLKYTNYRTRKKQEWGGGGLRKNFLVSKRSRM